MKYSKKAINTAEEDTIGRRLFVSRVISRVDKLNSGGSILISAPWGAGKTSVKNLIKNEISTKGKRYLLIEHNSWEQEDINNSLIHTINKRLSRLGYIFSSPKFIILRLYTGSLSNTSTSMSMPNKLIGILLSAIPVSLTAWLVVEFNSRVNLVVNSAALVTMTWLVFVLGKWALFKLIPYAKDIITMKALTVQEQKDFVRRQLSKSTSTIVILVDELDRLSPDNVSRNLRIISSNIDLPSVVFIAFADKNYLADCIDVSYKTEGLVFIEKIFDHVMYLPSISSDRMSDLFISFVDGYFDADALSDIKEKLLDIVLGYLKNIRKLHKLEDTFVDMDNNLRGDSWYGYLRMEILLSSILHCFEPHAIDWAKENKHLLTGDKSSGIGFRYLEIQNSYKAMIGDAAIPDSCSEIMAYLFGAIVEQLGGPELRIIHTHEQGKWGDLVNHASNVASFDGYFSIDNTRCKVFEDSIERLLEGESLNVERVVSQVGEEVSIKFIEALLGKYPSSKGLKVGCLNFVLRQTFRSSIARKDQYYLTARGIAFILYKSVRLDIESFTSSVVKRDALLLFLYLRNVYEFSNYHAELGRHIHEYVSHFSVADCVNQMDYPHLMLELFLTLPTYPIIEDQFSRLSVEDLVVLLNKSKVHYEQRGFGKGFRSSDGGTIENIDFVAKYGGFDALNRVCLSPLKCQSLPQYDLIYLCSLALEWIAYLKDRIEATLATYHQPSRPTLEAAVIVGA